MNRGLIRDYSSVAQSGNSPVKKKPSYSSVVEGSQQESERMDDDRSPAPSPAGQRSLGGDTGDAKSAAAASAMGSPKSKPPDWFMDFEARQEARFEQRLTECRDQHATFRFEIDNMRDEIKSLSKALEDSNLKIDDLENRSRRNNIILWGCPQKASKGEAAHPTSKISLQRLKRTPLGVQRISKERIVQVKQNPAERKPCPIHVGFHTYTAKETAKKSLIHHFK